MEHSTDQIIAALLNQGLKFEAFSSVEERDTYIGISTKQAHWDWFKGHTFSNGSICMSADHTYNQNIGKTRKSIMHRIKLEMKYKELLGVEVSFFQN
jgi:hypothetical protein